MPLGDRHVPEELVGRGLSPFAGFMLRLVLAGVFTGALVLIASVAMLFDTAPAWLSMIVEPLSLFLLPGLALAVATAGQRDLDAAVVVEASVAIYFWCFLVVLEWRAFRQRRRRLRG
jgi:hypothetical protein